MTCRNRTRYKIVRGVVILASVRTMRKGFLALARYPGAVMVRIHITFSSRRSTPSPGSGKTMTGHSPYAGDLSPRLTNCGCAETGGIPRGA